MCCSNITSGTIKDMKIDPRNKSRKTILLKLSTSLDINIYQGLMNKFDTSLIIEIYDFRNLKSEILPMMTWLIRVSLFTNLDHTKDLS